MPKLLQMDMQLVLVQAHFFPRLAEIWIWEKMVNVYVEKFKLNCSHYFQFRRNWDLKMGKNGLDPICTI